jgi:hypothetical protein
MPAFVQKYIELKGREITFLPVQIATICFSFAKIAIYAKSGHSRFFLRPFPAFRLFHA